MTRTFVFDTSALTALFGAYDPILCLYQRAERGHLIVAFPAAAVAAATQAVHATPAAWEAILWPQHVAVVPLTESAAVEAGSWTGGLDTWHVVWEALFLRGVVVTREPDLYGDGQVPLLAL